MIITIDGPVGTGKTTIARKLAERLHFVHLDTGAMYRVATYALLQQGIDLADRGRLEKFLEGFDFAIKLEGREKRYLYAGVDVTDQIRGETVTASVSKVSAEQLVREKLVELQRKLGNNVDAVIEGRDIGTVVFPKAELKIYLTARPEVQAKRRYDELLEKFPDDHQELTFEKVLDSIKKRDLIDSTREISPLRKADDAFEVDTSDLSIEEVLGEILKLKEKASK